MLRRGERNAVKHKSRAVGKRPSDTRVADTTCNTHGIVVQCMKSIPLDSEASVPAHRGRGHRMLRYDRP